MREFEEARFLFAEVERIALFVDGQDTLEEVVVQRDRIRLRVHIGQISR